MILALTRHIATAYVSLKSGRWEPGGFQGMELHGKTLGLVGLGPIGQEMARLGAGIGMKLVGWTRNATPDRARHGLALVPLPEVFSRSDVVSIHLSLRPETEHLVSRALLSRMKPEAYFVNTLYTSGFDPATMARTIELTRIMVLSPIFLALGAVATSVLNTEERFAAAVSAPIVYNLAIIGAAILLTPSLGAVGLAVGVVAGSLGHLLVQIPPLRRLGFRYTPKIDVSDPAARRALALMAPRAVGLGASQITFVVVTALATTVGLGAVTAFTIAFTLLQIPIGVIGVPLGVVLFPSLSRGSAIGDHEAFVGLLNRALRLLVVVMIPVAALAGILRVETVAVLFRSFDPAAIRLTADTFLAFLVGAPAHAVIAVLARAVLRAPGHAHPGPRRGRRRRDQHDPCGHPRRPVRATGARDRDRHRRISRGRRPDDPAATA